MVDLDAILNAALDRKASDVHLVAGHAALFRVNTKLVPLDDRVISQQDLEAAVLAAVGEARMRVFRVKRDLDFSYSIASRARFRVNAHWQRDSAAMAFRVVSSIVPEFASLMLPKIVASFTELPRGLVLVTGPTGSGKSTTLASLVNIINQNYDRHIITLEDPIEYLFKSQKSLVEQREAGTDVTDFASGLRHALRQDPDVILVGEMRDLETTSAAISAAETGHVVFSTLHTQSASQTVERIIDMYPPTQQNQVRSMLSTTLQAVVTQVLMRRSDGQGMVPACEVMICNSAVRNCIRENRIHELPNVIETNRQVGMCLLDDSLRVLALNRLITRDAALAKANRPDALQKMLAQ